MKSSGPEYLHAHSFNDIKSKLRSFFYENYRFVHLEIDKAPLDGRAFAFHVSPKSKEKLAKALEESKLFLPRALLALFPITPINIEKDFDSSSFYVASEPLVLDGKPPEVRKWLRQKADIGGWLGVRAPSVEAAKKIKRVILGGFALGPIWRERYSFTLRNVAENYLTYEEGTWRATRSWSLPHTPPLGNALIISVKDHVWLKELAKVVESSAKADRRKCKALEYFYRAWFLDDGTRATFLFMAVDALFGQGHGRSEEKVREGIERSLGSKLNEARFKKFWLIRNQMLHGGAPDVFASSSYKNYCKNFGVDPADELEILAAKCLRAEVFNGTFRPQADPFLDDIAEARAQGLIPMETEAGAFVEE